MQRLEQPVRAREARAEGPSASPVAFHPSNWRGERPAGGGRPPEGWKAPGGVKGPPGGVLAGIRQIEKLDSSTQKPTVSPATKRGQEMGVRALRVQEI